MEMDDDSGTHDGSLFGVRTLPHRTISGFCFLPSIQLYGSSHELFFHVPKGKDAPQATRRSLLPAEAISPALRAVAFLHVHRSWTRELRQVFETLCGAVRCREQNIPIQAVSHAKHSAARSC